MATLPRKKIAHVKAVKLARQKVKTPLSSPQTLSLSRGVVFVRPCFVVVVVVVSLRNVKRLCHSQAQTVSVSHCQPAAQKRRALTKAQTSSSQRANFKGKSANPCPVISSRRRVCVCVRVSFGPSRSVRSVNQASKKKRKQRKMS